MLNKVILIGKIFSDPELRYFKNNNVITIIKLITFENDDNGKQNSWHRIIVNKKCTGLKKNMIILVLGKIKTRRWIKNNKYNYITEIISENIQIINKDFDVENSILENEDNKYYDNVEKKENQENYLEQDYNSGDELEKIEENKESKLNKNKMVYYDNDEYDDYNNNDDIN